MNADRIKKGMLKVKREIKAAVTVNKAVEAYDLENMPIFEEIEIETLNRCNGKCSFCPVNVNEPQRPYHKMSRELFEKIINELSEADYSKKISLYSNNEPFLDERIVDFHKYARKKLPRAYFSIYTNGSMLNIGLLAEIEQYLDEIHIDNYNDDKKVNPCLSEVYEYLRNNNFLQGKVIFHKRLENEILYSRGGQAPNVKQAGGGKSLKYKCLLPYRMMVIRPDGKVSLCCSDALGKYTLGDVTKQSIMEIWNGEAMKEVRFRMKNVGRDGLELCNACDIYTFPFKKSNVRK